MSKHSLRLERVRTAAKLSSLVAQYTISLLMAQSSREAAKNVNAHWEDTEIEALLRHLIDRNPGHEGSGGFNNQVFQGAISVIAPFYKKGAVKDVKIIKRKWTNVRIISLSDHCD